MLTSEHTTYYHLHQGSCKCPSVTLSGEADIPSMSSPSPESPTPPQIPAPSSCYSLRDQASPPQDPCSPGGKSKLNLSHFLSSWSWQIGVKTCRQAFPGCSDLPASTVAAGPPDTPACMVCVLQDARSIIFSALCILNWDSTHQLESRYRERLREP